MEEEKIVTIVFEIILITALILVAFIGTIVYFRYKRNNHFKETILLQQAFEAQLLQVQLEVQEQTRLYIAEELHDNIAALAALIKMNLWQLSKAKEPTKVADLIETSQTQIKDLIRDVKQMSISLHTDRLSNICIGEAICHEVQRIKKLDLFKINVTIVGEDQQLPNDKQIILFRVCQELLHNILKHAQPTTVSVAIVFTPTTLAVTIEDDGKGFDIAAASKKK